LKLSLPLFAPFSFLHSYCPPFSLPSFHIFPARPLFMVFSSLPKLLPQGNTRPKLPQIACSKWYPSSEYSPAIGRQVRWKRYGYISHHSTGDYDRYTESRQWRGQVCYHFMRSLWTDYAEIGGTIHPVRLCSTVGIYHLVWHLFLSGLK
jgi:hypothetical protein